MPKKGYKQTEEHKKIHKKFTDDQEKEICKEYFSKTTTTGVLLAKRWGCTNPTITSILKRNGHKPRTKEEARKIFTKEEELQVCNEYFSKEKPSTIVLSKKWNCSDVAIRAIIIRNGYKLRTISEANKGHAAWNKNIPCSEESKQKMRDKKLGTKQSEETVRKRIKKLLGHKSWSKGLTKETNESLKKSSESHKNIPCSKESKEKMSKSALLRIQTHPGPFKDTKPELKMKEILNSLNIPFEHQFRLENHLFDFHILNTNTLIEVDGDYWHGNPKKYSKLSKKQKENKQRDIKHSITAKDNGFVLLRFWQSDILTNTEEVKIELLNWIN